MFPIPNLNAVYCAWIEIKSGGLTLYGFLLFIGSDHSFPEYLQDEGLADFEGWTGGRCEIFILQSPSSKWVDYARKSEHVWWKIFCAREQRKRVLNIERHLLHFPSRHGMSPNVHTDYESHKDTLLSQFHVNAGKALLEIDGKKYSVTEVFSPCLNQFQHTMEIQKVLYRFNLKPTDHPCLIFFKDLQDTRAWFVGLGDLLNLPKVELRAALKEWFAGPEFRELMKEANGA
jgi:hypothetical protein